MGTRVRRPAAARACLRNLPALQDGVPAESKTDLVATVLRDCGAVTPRPRRLAPVAEGRVVFAAPVTAKSERVPAIRLVKENLAYATELEGIV